MIRGPRSTSEAGSLLYTPAVFDTEEWKAMHRRLLLGIACLAAFLLFGCATAQIETAWRDPATTPRSLEFEKVVVVAMARDGVLRRKAEDELVLALQKSPRAQAGDMTITPSYRVLEEREISSTTHARETMKAEGFDGAVLVSFLSAQEKITLEAGSYPAGGMWGYYGRRGAFYDPVSVRSDTIVRIQTDIYSVEQEKLLWSGVSRSMNPSNVEGLVAGVADAVAAELRKEGLLP
jgi:hypothetical protein